MPFLIVALVLIFVVSAAIICFKLRSPIGKGKRGEAIVAKILGENIDGVQYVVNNLLFDTQTGTTCQIDHVYINKFGIWVIETKNYSGKIYGEENQQEWTQILSYGRIKNKFYNPIKQNKTHIYYLSQYLNAQYIFHNIVVFLDNADISGLDAVVYTTTMLPSIKNPSFSEVLSPEEMKNYYESLLQLKSQNISKEEHVANIYKKQEQINQGICPRCGGKLVLRRGKTEFWGCSNYPRCKFTKKK